MLSSGIVFGMEVVGEEAQGFIDHVPGARGDLGAAAEASEIVADIAVVLVADIAVVLLDGEGQVLAGEELIVGDEAMEAFPVIAQEDIAFDADFVEKPLDGVIITPTQLPGQGSPCHRIIGPPDPNLVFFPSTKCHISSICTIPADGLASGSGVASASARSHL